MHHRVVTADGEDIEPAIKDCNRNIKVMNAALKVANTSGEKHHITTCAGHMHGFRSMLKSLRYVTGTGYKPTHPTRENFRSLRVKWQDLQTAFSNRMRTGIIINLTHKDPRQFMEDAKKMIIRRMTNDVKKSTLKVNAVFCGEFVTKKMGKEVFEFKYINTRNVAIYNNTDLEEWFKSNIQDSVLKALEEFQEKDSGWALNAIVNLQMNINKYTPQLGSSYIELPRALRLKHAYVNVKNDDEACFAWAVTSALYPANHHIDRTYMYPHYSEVLNMKNIAMPMVMKQIPRFEQQNDVSVNVYILESLKKGRYNVVPSYLAKERRGRHVNLLLIQDKYVEEEDGDDDGEFKPRFHYVWIKDLSRLVSSQLSIHHTKKYFCERCLHYFYSSTGLEKHVKDCAKMNECRIRMPKEGETVYFKNFQNKESVPFVVYADLECLLIPTTKTDTQHKPYSIDYYVKCSYDESLSFYKSYAGENCQQWFVTEMKQLAEDVETIFLCPLPMEPLTEPQELEFRSLSCCHICENRFDVGDVRVRDHCHLTGKYRGTAHEDCNINYQDSHVIPVVFHNLSGYDSHFIIKNLAKDFEGRIDLLPINKERYISFTKNIDQNLIKFRFIDSFRFMASSLDKLASYTDSFPNLKTQFPNLDESKFNLLTRKGVFPYDYLDSFTKLNETALPDESTFYNSMTDSHIADTDYTHANEVWNAFGCQNLGNYSELYLKTDILLLADVFEQFRASCLNSYSLDPAHYYTLPGYTWDCMLKYTRVKLELLTDIDMAMFIERGIRGGLSQCSKRYASANNKYLPNYKSAEPSKFIIYDDINNQYGWAMSQYLPYGGFKWVEGNNINFNVPEDNPEGYILEVDLEYPESIHDSNRDLPFCPEHRAPPNSKQTKLMGTLYNKERYVLHYRNLQQAIENGLILTKIHRVLEFKQSAWLKSYINLNTKFRTAAINDFDKNLFKLMNNAVFGKTMENIRKHSIVKLVTKWGGRYGAEALIAKPNFKSSIIFDENLVAIELNKMEIYFNKPIYVGMCILDISKLKIYDFHYSYMRRRFGDKARVCYTDTDSLIYEVECPDLYEVIRRDASKYFDTSDYPENNIYNIPRVNKKVLGMMKDENAGKVMTEFVGLRSKMYACRVEGGDKV
ncbi:uncharacterized protein [Onthophagus taurus]|uniref:uncharacterized protein n=1 Tax=Onthophagus taurus TaxID=166361 RepID=UPI0039BE2230